MASPEITGITINDLSKEEIVEEMERSKAIILLKYADENRFSTLANRLREGTYLNRDEFPTSVATVCKLMTQFCGFIQGPPANMNNRNRM